MRLDQAAGAATSGLRTILNFRSSQVKPAEAFTLHNRSIIATIFIALGASLPLFAQESRCAVDPHDSSCALDSTLHLLRIVAVILAIILIVIIAAAITAYRKNQHKKLTPDD